MEVYDMTKLEMDRKKAVSLLSSFGENVKDLKLVLRKGTLTIEVGSSQYYLIRKIQLTDMSKTKHTDGIIDITALHQTIQFMKKAKGDTVTIEQSGKGKTLYIKSGKTKLQYPTYETVVSHSKTRLFGQIVKDAVKNMWSVWSKQQLPIELHGTVDISELKTVASMKGIIGLTSIKVKGNAEEKEFNIQAGKAHSGKLQITVDLIDPDGPRTNIESFFGPWFMECIGLLDDAPASVHFGEGTIIAFEQHNTSQNPLMNTLLIIIDQSRD